MTALPLAAGSAGPSPLWYTTRATGAVTLALLTAIVVLGITSVSRLSTPRWPRMITLGVHRNLSLLAVCFLAVHILTALLDTFAPVGWASALVPFASGYRPLWLGLGTVASDLILALVVTSLVRARLGYQAWRAVHWLAYAAWPVALWHGLGTGTDSRLPLMLGIDAACLLAVLVATWWRLSWVAGSGPRVVAFAGTSTAVLGTVLFAAAGPLSPGWARRAGTPVALLGHAARQPASAAPGHSPERPVSGPFTGNVSQSPPGGSGQLTITVTGHLTGMSPAETIVITLHGVSDGQGGIVLSAGAVAVTAGGQPGRYAGPVTGLAGDKVVAALAGPGSYRARATITLVISGSSASGRLSLGGEDS